MRYFIKFKISIEKPIDKIENIISLFENSRVTLRWDLN